ncbi:MAG TPA: ABC transporter permease [Cellulomonas sp.]
MTGPVVSPQQASRASSTRLTLLVAQREVTAQLRSRAFVVSTVILLVGVLAGIVIGSALSHRDSAPTAGTAGQTQKVAVVPATSADLAGARGFTAVPVADEAAARAAVRAGDVVAAMLPEPGSAGVRIVALNSAPTVLVAELTRAPAVEVLNPATASEAMRYLVPLAFGMVFLIVVMVFGQTIAQNTIVEKQTRVVEVLLSAVPARVLMAGKVAGNSVLALGQAAAMALVTLLALKVTGQDHVISLVGAPVGWFVVFFVFGFVLFAAMFAAAASLVSRVEDSGPVIMPVTLLGLLPFYLVLFGSGNLVLMRVLSYVPFSAVMGMPVRIYLGDAAWWEPFVSLVVLIATAAGVVWLAALVYQRSVLRMGARVHLKDVLGRRAASA